MVARKRLTVTLRYFASLSITNTAFFLHVSTTLVAILREVTKRDGYYKILQRLLNKCTDVKY